MPATDATGVKVRNFGYDQSFLRMGESARAYMCVCGLDPMTWPRSPKKLSQKGKFDPGISRTQLMLQGPEHYYSAFY